MIMLVIIILLLIGMITGAMVIYLEQGRKMVTKIQIIGRLWSHITDLRLLQNGVCSKTLEEIEKEIDVTEMLCRPYADSDDEEIFK